MVQVGPFHVHKDIYDGHYYPPQPEDYLPDQPALKPIKIALLAFGLILLGVGIGTLLPV